MKIARASVGKLSSVAMRTSRGSILSSPLAAMTLRLPPQRAYARRGPWQAPPELRRMAADRVGEWGARAHQSVAQGHKHQRGLLVRGLRRHEAHGRSAHRLAQSLGIRRVVLGAFDVCLDEWRREKLHFMAERAKRPPLRPLLQHAFRVPEPQAGSAP